jgi:hypothetical protein
VATEDMDAERGDAGRGTPPSREPAPRPTPQQAQADRDFVQGKDQGKEETGEAASESVIHDLRKRLVAHGLTTKPAMLEFVNAALEDHGPVDGIRHLTDVQAKLIDTALAKAGS